MKFKISFILLVVMLCFENLKAQQDLQINLSNLIFYEFNVNYEFKEVINQATIGVLGGYVYGFPNAEGSEYFNIGSEFRYYVSSQKTAHGFFFGLYSRYKNGFENLEVDESGYSINDPTQWVSNFQDSNVKFQSVVVGISLGMKWVTESNLIFGFHVGLGRNIYYNRSDIEIKNSIIDQIDPDTYFLETYSYSDIDSEFIDFRTGFNIGYRFGTLPIFRSED